MNAQGHHDRRKGGENKAMVKGVIGSKMETFAAKVRYESGPRFDPLLEEKGGWIAGEARGQDVGMLEAVIEALVEVSQQISERDLNPFKEQIGEILPSNLERNFSGFLIRKDAIPFKVDSEKLRVRIALQD